jgi:hemoglobin-like flavoprotein
MNGLRKPKIDNFKKKSPQLANNSLESLASQILTLAKNLANPKDKEKYLDLKERHYRAFLIKINKYNNYNIPFPQQVFHLISTTSAKEIIRFWLELL